MSKGFPPSSSYEDINNALLVYFGVEAGTGGYNPIGPSGQERLQHAYPDNHETLYADIEGILRSLDRPLIEWFVPVPMSDADSEKIDSQITSIYPWLTKPARHSIGSYFTFNYK